jgi:PiT family inorganic phosphate transporter
MAWAVVAGALLLAFVNGANDNMKGVATLYGPGALGYRAALRLATISTAFGALASTFLADALLEQRKAECPERTCRGGVKRVGLLKSLPGCP